MALFPQPTCLAAIILSGLLTTFAGPIAIAGPSAASESGNLAEELAAVSGIQTKEMRGRGWYQNGAPKVFQEPTLFPAQAVAASSRACAELGDESGFGASSVDLRDSQKQCENQGGYETAHLYVSIAHDISDDMAAGVSAEDPWFKNKKLRSRVLLVKSEQRSDIRKLVLNLLRECKVVSYVYLSSHGNSGNIAWGKGGSLGIESVGYFMQRAFSPCMLAPGARVQFDGCNLACGQGAEQVRHQLDRALDTMAYRTKDARYPANDPFDGVEFFANTAVGMNWVPGGFARFFGFRPHAWSVNDLGIVYQRSAGMMNTDIPTDKTPACVEPGRRGD